jgi:4-diphosphocytidyl-2-C-methyl-D-erythritol kinase
MVLTKRIPVAAGLAGGSTNAAAALTGLNRFWDLDASSAVLDEIAAGLGSDINFFLAGRTALCRGRGERVEPLAHRVSGWVLLVNPGFGISTAWAYRAWSEMPRKRSSLTELASPVSVLRQALADGDLQVLGRALYNSLETPALRKFPVLELLKQRLLDRGAAGAMMSGSGATVFGLFEHQDAAENAATDIRAEFGPSMWTRLTRMRSSTDS